MRRPANVYRALETLVILRQPKMASFLILSFKLTLQIFLRHFIWKTSSLCIKCVGSAEVSLAYNNVDCTITLYRVRVMPLLMHSSSQTCGLDNFNQALAALADLSLTSALTERSEVCMLPKFLTFETCSISC